MFCLRANCVVLGIIVLLSDRRLLLTTSTNHAAVAHQLVGMAHSPVFHDKGTRFTNYSSIHSADAFVGEYQVMYTPGASPQVSRANRKSTRFSRGASSSKPQQNMSQSYLLPSNMPNTSQIMPDHGPLPNIQVHYNTIPPD